MLVKFVAGLPKDEAKIAEQEYNSAFNFRKRLTEMLEQDIQNEYDAVITREFDVNEQIERIAKIKVYKKMQNYLK